MGVPGRGGSENEVGTRPSPGALTSAVPPLIHQIWIQGVEELPRRYRRQARTWQRHNPDWQYRLWDDAALIELIAARYPQLLPVYRAYEEAIPRADIGRYAVLDAFGGLYVDMDTVCVRPLGVALAEPGISLFAQIYDNPIWNPEPGEMLAHVSNAVIACEPQHALLALIIDHLVAGQHPHDYWILATGPEMFQGCLRHYLATHDDVAYLTRAQILTAYYLSRHYLRWSAWRRASVFALHFNDSARPEWRPSFRGWLWPTLDDFSVRDLFRKRQ